MIQNQPAEGPGENSDFVCANNPPVPQTGVAPAPHLDSSSVLNRIVDNRYSHLESIRKRLADKRRCGADRHRPLYSLRAAIREAKGPGLIMECKAASPSQGQLSTNYDPVKLARMYQPYAAGISVLVEPDFFQGDYDHLQAVADAVDRPILCKDFIVSREQIEMAYLCGADAVLLMLSVLDDERYRELADFAARYGLEVLTEVLTEDEARRAGQLGANLVDINHRNLHTLQIDLDRCYELAPLLKAEAAAGERASADSNTGNQRPGRLSGDKDKDKDEGEVTIVAASGMHDAAQIRARLDVAQGFLVGSALSGAADPKRSLRQLVYGSNKICGLTTEEAARAAEEFCIYGGLIWAPTSPRYVDMETSCRLIKAAPDLSFLVVLTESDLGALQDLARLARHLGAGGLQLHYPPLAGGLPDEIRYLNALRSEGPADFELVRALPISVGADFIAALLDSQAATRILVDAPQPGSGQRWNWRDLPETVRKRVWLAGGLGPDNLEEVLRSDAAGLDFNSALEEKAGRDEVSSTGNRRRKSLPKIARLRCGLFPDYRA